MLKLGQTKVVGIFLFCKTVATGNTYAVGIVCEIETFIGFVVWQRIVHGNLLAETLPF